MNPTLNLYAISLTDRGMREQNDRVDMFVVAETLNEAELMALKLDMAEHCYVSSIMKVASTDIECCPAVLIV